MVVKVYMLILCIYMPCNVGGINHPMSFEFYRHAMSSLRPSILTGKSSSSMGWSLHFTI